MTDEFKPAPSGRCPSCNTVQLLRAPDDIEAHLDASGEYCPGSRGAPALDPEPIRRARRERGL